MGIGVEDFNRCCRCCLTMVNDMKPLFGAYLNVMLKKLMNLQLAPMDGYPQQMCSRCILKLSSAYTFYTAVLKNQTHLEEILKAAENGDIPAIVGDYSEKTELNIPGKEVNIPVKENSVCKAACVEHFLPKGSPCPTPNQNSTSRDISPSVNNGRQLDSESEISSENEESHQCAQCPHCSKNEEELKIHLETHLSAESVCKVEADVNAQLCNICGARFRWRTSLHKHLRQHRARRACAHCHKTFAEASTLKVHLVSHSLEPKPYRCHACSRTFTQQASRDKHARQHDTRPQLPCNQCDKSFLHKYSLQRHQESTHSLHECTICKKLVTGKKILGTHMRLHKKEEMDCSNTEMPIDNTVTESINIQTVTVEFLCLLCATKFQTRESLEVHICATENIT